MRLWFILGVAAAVFYIFSVVDCAVFERNRIRGLPKQAWVIIILLLPVIGGVLWFTIGRGPQRSVGTARRSTAPDDDPEFLARIRFETEQEQRIRKLEQKLADLDDTKRDTDPGSRDA